MTTIFAMDSTANEPVFTQYRHNAQGAIKALMEAGAGVAVAALYHPDVGDIDLRWGSASESKSKDSGLAKLIKWHPEALNDLQGFIEQMAVDREGPGRIWLVRGADVAILAKDWRGTSGNWLLTAYTKKANTAGNTMDAACFASLDDTATQESVGKLIIGLESGVVNPAFDDAGTPDVAAMMARLKLTGELGELRKQIAALGSGAADMLARLKLAARSNEIRKQLGAGVPVVPPAPAPSEVKKAERHEVTRFVIKEDIGSTEVEWQYQTSSGWGVLLSKLPSLEQAKAIAKSQGYDDAESIPVFKTEWNPKSKRFNPAVPVGDEVQDPEQVKALREVIAGAHDAKGLAELFGIIQEAVNGLEEAGMLSGDAEAVANDAITHWAELEERLNANV